MPKKLKGGPFSLASVKTLGQANPCWGYKTGDANFVAEKFRRID